VAISYWLLNSAAGTVLTAELAESESYIMTDGQSASLSWNKAPIWGLRPDFITVRQLRVCWYGALSLSRGRLCCLQLLQALASAVILGSEFRGTRDRILLFEVWDFLFVAFYDSQGYGGGIWPRLHTGLTEHATSELVLYGRRSDQHTENTASSMLRDASVGVTTWSLLSQAIGPGCCLAIPIVSCAYFGRGPKMDAFYCYVHGGGRVFTESLPNNALKNPSRYSVPKRAKYSFLPGDPEFMTHFFILNTQHCIILCRLVQICNSRQWLLSTIKNRPITIESAALISVVLMCHTSGDHLPTSHLGDPNSIEGYSTWDSWCGKWHWSRFSASILVLT
jgi:hypothetical protein